MALEDDTKRGRTHFEAQLAQFTLQFVVSQSRIVPCHAENPLFQFGINRRAS